MRVSIAIVGTTLLLTSVMCGTRSEQQLLWADEFDYIGRPDSTRWVYQTGDGCPELCGWGNKEEQIYTNDARNIRVRDGKLVIEAVKENGQWTSGRLTTQSTMQFTYGRIEFRAKLPAGVGSWPALWLLGANIESIGWPACGEIDVMEHLGKNPGVISSALHTNASSGNTVNVATTQAPAFDSQFHTYAAEWTENKIDFYLDQNKYYTYAPEVKNKDTWPYDAPFFILMNIAMGGNLGGPITDESLSSVKMEVDYVRIYKINK